MCPKAKVLRALSVIIFCSFVRSPCMYVSLIYAGFLKYWRWRSLTPKYEKWKISMRQSLANKKAKISVVYYLIFIILNIYLNDSSRFFLSFRLFLSVTHTHTHTSFTFRCRYTRSFIESMFHFLFSSLRIIEEAKKCGNAVADKKRITWYVRSGWYIRTDGCTLCVCRYNKITITVYCLTWHSKNHFTNCIMGKRGSMNKKLSSILFLLFSVCLIRFLFLTFQYFESHTV